MKRIKFKEFDNHIKGYGFMYDVLYKNEIIMILSDHGLIGYPYKIVEEFKENKNLPKYCVGKKREQTTKNERYTGYYIEYIEIPRGTLTFWLEVDDSIDNDQLRSYTVLVGQS